MAKNMTRRALAVAAATALGSSLLAATPAVAAGELTIEPDAGSVYAVPSGNVFGVKAYFSPGYASTEKDKIKFALTSAGGYVVDAAVASSAVASASTDTIASDKTSAVIAAEGSSSPTFLGLAIDSAAADTTYTVGVQAWVDADNDNVIDSGEWTSNTETVTFLKHADIAWSVDLKDLTRGDTTAEARVTASNINIQQLDTSASGDLDTQVAAVFYDGSDLVYSEGSADTTAATYAVADGDTATVPFAFDSTNGWLDATSGTLTALAAGDSVKVDVYFESTPAANSALNTANDALDIAVGGVDGLLTGTANDTVAKTKTEAVATAVVTANTAVTAAASGNNTAESSNEIDVRTGATTVTVSSTVTYSGTNTSAPVTFTVSEQAANSLDSGASISAGGQTLTNTNAGTVQKFDVVVNADADGKATLTLTLSGLKKGNKFTVDSVAQGYSGTALTATVADAAATNLYNVNSIGANSDSGVVTAAKDANKTLSYVLLDQFGNIFAGAGHTVTVSDGTLSWSADISDGSADVVIPGYATTGTRTMTPTVYKNGADVSISEPTLSFKVGTENPAASITGAGDTGTATGSREDLNLKANANADTRYGETAPTVTANTDSTITGSVKDSNLDGVVTTVTLSSASLMFEADGVWSIGEITVLTQADGSYSVDAYSNTSGKHVVTITSGAASVTEELWFKAAADDTATVLTIDAPEYVAPGKTLTYVATLTDQFGNPVAADNDSGNDENVKLSYSGPGFSNTAPTEFDSDGEARLSVLLGTNDSGTATLTVSYDQNRDGDYTDAKDLVVTKTVTIGEAPADTKVNAGSFKGYVAVYAKGYEGQRLSAKIGKDWVVVPALASNFERIVDFTGAGVDIAVRIYIDRVLMDTINLTTK